MADKEFKTKNGIIANGDITANGTLYLTLGSDAAGDIYTRAANGALTRVAKGANNTLLVVNTTGGHTYATVNSALLANNSVANQHISGANTIHGSVLVDSSVGSEQLVHADIISIVTDEPSISANSIYDDQINPNHINTAAKFESTQYAQLRVNTASAVATAGANEDELVVENAANAGISILTPNTGTGKVTFGDSASGTRASVAYEHSSDRFKLIAAGAEKLTLNSTVMAVNGTIAMTLGSDATGDVYVRSSSGTLERVAKGANGTYFGVNSTSGYQFSTFTIGADSINPAMINTAATFENTSFQVVTAGELIISNTQPEIYLLDTNGNTGFYGTRLTEHEGNFKLSTVNSTSIWQSDDYVINKNANGALNHHFYVQKVIRTTINSTALAVNTDIDVTGTGTFTSNIEANGTLRVIKATSGGTATGDADEIIIENNANAGISILTPNSAVGRINFGDPQDGDTGYIRYEHSGDSIVLGRASQDILIVNSEVIINSAANVGGVLTAGELVITKFAPKIILTETDDSTGTRIIQSGGDLSFQTLNATGGVIETSYRIFTDAAGASVHRWWVGADQKLNITGTTTTVNTDMDVAGTLDVNGAISSVDNIDVTGIQPSVVLTETDAATTHQKTGLVGSTGNFYIQTRNSANTFVTNDYFITRDATGAISHAFNSGGARRLDITNTSMDVYTSMTVNGAANVGGVLTAGELIISNVAPEIILTETDDSTGTRIVQSAGDLYFQSLNATGQIIETSYRIFTDAAGASVHRWWVGADQKLDITGTTTTVNTALKLPSYSEGTLQVNSTGFVIANSAVGQYTAHADNPKTLSSSTNFTGIPSGVTELVLVLDGVTHSNTIAKVMYSRIGDSGGIETAGYASAVMGFQTGTSTLITHAINNGFTFTDTGEFNGSALGADILGGVIYYKKGNGNDWAVSGTTTITGASNTNFQISGTKTLSGVLDRMFVLITTASFVDGTASLYYR